MIYVLISPLLFFYLSSACQPPYESFFLFVVPWLLHSSLINKLYFPRLFLFLHFSVTVIMYSSTNILFYSPSTLNSLRFHVHRGRNKQTINKRRAPSIRSLSVFYLSFCPFFSDAPFPLFNQPAPSGPSHTHCSIARKVNFSTNDGLLQLTRKLRCHHIILVLVSLTVQPPQHLFLTAQKRPRCS